MTSTLRALLDRVEKGEGQDEELDVRLVAAFFAPATALVEASPFNGAWCIYDGTEWSGRPRLWEKRPLGYQSSPTSSIDAAVALVEKVLPGHDHEVFRDRDAKLVTVDLTKPIGGGASSGYLGQHAEEPRATLLALLRAKIAQEERT